MRTAHALHHPVSVQTYPWLSPPLLRLLLLIIIIVICHCQYYWCSSYCCYFQLFICFIHYYDMIVHSIKYCFYHLLLLILLLLLLLILVFLFLPVVTILHSVITIAMIYHLWRFFFCLDIVIIIYYCYSLSLLPLLLLYMAEGKSAGKPHQM